MLQDGAEGSALVTLCIFAVIKGESCRTGNKLLLLGETSGVSQIWRQHPWEGAEKSYWNQWRALQNWGQNTTPGMGATATDS